MANLDISRRLLMREEKKEQFGLIDVFLIFLLVVMLSNIFVQTYVLAPVKVDGNSMNQTLNDGDWLFMNKVKEPERGAVVVFEKSRNINYIKRIIALEGDEIYGDVSGIHLKKKGETEWTLLEDEFAYYCQNQNSPYANLTYTIIPRQVVGEGEMFVLGDNRNDSTDSRTIGLVKTSSILGVVPDWAIKNRNKYARYLRFVEKINYFIENLKKD